jgi:outer membrane protein
MTRTTQLRLAIVLSLVSCCSPGRAQQGEQPPPFTAPNPPMPDVTHGPGQQTPPDQQRPEIAPDAPLPQPDQTTIDVRRLAPLSAQPPSPGHTSSIVQQAADSDVEPKAEAPSALDTHFFNLVGPYRAPKVAALPAGSLSRLAGLVHDGKLYLSLHDAIALAIENNLDVEVSRYNLLLADTDLTRARGGGNLRGIDYTILQTPPGVGAATSPLLITATTGNASSTNAAVTDLSQVTQTGSSTQENLSQNGTSTYSAGSAIPLYDPTVTGQAGYFRRSDQTSLIDLSSSGGTAESGPQNFVSAGIDYQQGFSTGAQLDAFVDNAAQVLYGNGSQYDPFHAPSTSFTLTQPLLRGRGREVNLRFIRIARLDQHASRLLFEQQLLETVYGISRLYYDLVSLGENVGVKEQSLAAAQRLYQDDSNQAEQGTLAPVELTRTQALLSSSRLDLIQAQGEYRQQEAILRQQLLRKLGDPSANFAAIVAEDRIVVPDTAPALDVPALIDDAIANRPDLAEAGLQIKADEISVRAARNYVRPGLNVFGNVQTRGASLAPFTELGSTGTGLVTVPSNLAQGGLRLSTIYQAGVQLSLPLRNRIAQADAARDAIQLRQAEGRSLQLENEIRQQIENAAIALETAHQAYGAAVESRNYQEQLLQAEKDKFSVGESTNYLIVQDQAYLAQARSTEVAARSDWMKARITLDRTLGDLLEKNNISLDDAIRGKLQ